MQKPFTEQLHQLDTSGIWSLIKEEKHVIQITHKESLPSSYLSTLKKMEN